MENEFTSYTGPIYKYRSFGEVGSNTREYSRKLVRNGEIYFSKPSAFNDVFDSLPSIELIRKIVIDNPIFNLSGTVGVKDAIDYPDMLEKFLLQIFDNSIGIFCASSRFDSLQQWSYYANSHYGFCVEIDEVTNQPGYLIKYSRSRPKIDLISFLETHRVKKEEALRILLTKQNSWEHESEVRFFRESAGPYCIPAKIKRVFLGCRTGSKERKLIEEWITESGVDIKVETVSKDLYDYLVVRDIPTRSPSMVIDIGEVTFKPVLSFLKEPGEMLKVKPIYNKSQIDHKSGEKNMGDNEEES